MKFVTLEKEEYKKFASNHPLRHYLQTVEMEKISENGGFKSLYIGVKNNNQILAASRLVYKKNRLGQSYFYAPRGPLLDYNNKELLTFFTKEIKKYIKSKKGYVLHIDPSVIHKQRDINGDIVKDGIDNTNILESLKKLGYQHLGFNTWYEYSRQVRWVFCLDLHNKTEEQLLNEMKPNTRNHIRKTIRYGVEIKEISYDELPIYNKIMDETSERRNFKNRNLEYYQEMYNLLTPKKMVKFLIAYLDISKYIDYLKQEIEKEQKNIEELPSSARGKKKASLLAIEQMTKKQEEALKLQKEDGDRIYLSGAMFLLYQDEIIYFHSGSYSKYMNFNAQYLIQWYMIKYGVENKYRRYNFYGITGNFDKNDENYGVYDFKRGFNGYVEEYIGDFELPISWYYYISKIKDKLKKKA